jgi:hypothetical protein
MPYLTLTQINEMDIVDFLADLGYRPEKISGDNYWYLSMLPGRSETSSSFKVNRLLNRWFDFGDGSGSTLVDFGIRYFNCSIRELVIRLSTTPSIQKFVSPKSSVLPQEPAATIQIIRTYPIHSPWLISYLRARRIPLHVAQKFNLEAQYTLKSGTHPIQYGSEKTYIAIAFRCDAGGFELRNKYYKCSSSPKSPTLIRNRSRDVAVFEGHFDMQTFVAFCQEPQNSLPDLLVLNSTSFFKTALQIIDLYHHKHLFLDNDATGNKLTDLALTNHSGYFDHRPLYKGNKDLNEWACHTSQPRIPPFDQ